jgi:DNA-binding NtrC family response regulator
VRLGSAPGNEALLSDPSVSRFHCTIDRSADGLVVEDAGSTNGTFLGPYRVRVAYLSEGATLRLGQTTLAVRVSERARALEVSLRNRFGGLLGESPGMRALFAMLERLCQAEIPVLIEGETGSGKELVARALHTEGPRRAAPFVVVDCGAIAPTLVESELFGHTRGAFTGADTPRAGAFETAGAGTLFLDEVGELPLALQPKLLRALESGVVKPLGATREVPVQARIVAATHRDLRRMANEGAFREDLYFRLAAFPVRVPPLRERLEDIPLLARHFLARALAATGAAGADRVQPTAETLEILKAQPWPGNVRELRHAVERAVVLGDPAELGRGDLSRALREIGAQERRAEPFFGSLEEAKRRFEREFLMRLFARHAGDLQAAAEEADLHPKSLQRLCRRHGLRR